MIIISAGGTGGHIAPGEALAEKLKEKGEQVFLFTDSRGLKNYKSKFSDNAVKISALPFSKSKIKALFALGIGVLQSIYHIIKLKPKAIIGMGGYASAPAVIAGILLKRKVFLHEQNAVLGKVNRVLASSVKLVALSYKETLKVPENVNTVFTGMPLRSSVLSLKNHEYKTEDKLQILVTGGSQGASIFGKYVPKAVSMLDENLRKKLKVIHQIRVEDINPTVATYQKCGVEHEVSSFFEDMPLKMSSSHLVIGRGGSSTINEALTLGIPLIIVPLKSAADNHQTYNARVVSDNNAGWLINEDDFNEEILKKRLNDILTNHELLYNARKQALKLGDVDATEVLSKIIMENI
ncbi:MAG: UDP-N-acetylglucosamine--N-acetylmuramyl-(pentapeptide) pyrophosphoryl-undecaprenol N-acetylglucosamine transferase [Alphaproteobacteria bacterium ADurb.Bin438]|nr:MAG: UDP-N-acetylglucosamine--N-acetylmuramyl-(pentapeptide) pyrophosphoryl-undecaprenol N-acetylglucosamine transferase [Alphaproteobacteria bacterium ADurb.Bin438]